MQSYFISIFYELTDSRTYSAGGSPLPLPISEIKSYCEFFYISNVDERERFLHMVRAMDRKYLAVAAKKSKEADKAPRKPPAKPVR